MSLVSKPIILAPDWGGGSQQWVIDGESAVRVVGGRVEGGEVPSVHPLIQGVRKVQEHVDII